VWLNTYHTTETKHLIKWMEDVITPKIFFFWLKLYICWMSRAALNKCCSKCYFSLGCFWCPQENRGRKNCKQHFFSWNIFSSYKKLMSSKVIKFCLEKFWHYLYSILEKKNSMLKNIILENLAQFVFTISLLSCHFFLILSFVSEQLPPGQ